MTAPIRHAARTIACRLGREDIVSKRRDAPYQHGRSRTWLKVKNPASPAMTWVWEERF
jgi:ATP-dependent DNA ligase